MYERILLRKCAGIKSLKLFTFLISFRLRYSLEIMSNNDNG